jgi:hypothetical protein
MKKGILSLMVLCLVFGLAGCDNDSGTELKRNIFDGTFWTYDDGGTLKFYEGTFEMKNKMFFKNDTQKMDYEGKYTVSNDIATMTNWRSRPAGTSGAWTNRDYTGYAYLEDLGDDRFKLWITSDRSQLPSRSFFGPQEEIIVEEAIADWAVKR